MEQSPVVRRYPGLDMLKLLCAFMVIGSHIGYRWQAAVLPAFKTCVPVFFMITGYFYQSTVSRGRKGAQIRKLLRLLLLASLLYTVWGLFLAYLQSAPPHCRSAFFPFARDWLSHFFFGQPSAWCKFILLNHPVAGGHLWYLSSILYALLLLALLECFFQRKQLYPLIPLLLGLCLCMGEYSALFFHRTFPLIYTRNFLLQAFPCVLLGDYIREHEKALCAKKKLLPILPVLFLLSIRLEANWLSLIPGRQERGFYISTVLLAVSLFLLALQYTDREKRPLVACLSRWGQCYTLGIYILHALVIDAFLYLAQAGYWTLPWLFPVYTYTAPLIIFLISLPLTAIFSAFFKLLSRKLAALRSAR